MKAERSKGGDGFSILELLIVIAVMLLLASATMSVTNSVLESNNLTRGGNMLVDAISKARQLAAAQNRAVEVRLIRQQRSGSEAYTGIEVASIAPDGSSTVIGKVLNMPDGIAISDAASLSPLMGILPSTAWPGGGGMTYRAFRIRPNGTVEPVPGVAQRSNLFLTVVSARHASQVSAPENYMTVQINPDTGSTLAYRP